MPTLIIKNIEIGLPRGNSGREMRIHRDTRTDIVSIDRTNFDGTHDKFELKIGKRVRPWESKSYKLYNNILSYLERWKAKLASVVADKDDMAEFIEEYYEE